MILIVANQNDSCAQLVHHTLWEQKAEVVFLEDSQLQTTLGLNWSPAHPAGSDFLLVHSQKFPFATISSVLARIRNLTLATTDLSEEDQQYIHFKISAAEREKNASREREALYG